MIEHAFHPVSERAGYLSVWRWLVALLVAGLMVLMLPIPKVAAIVLIFAIAAVKAALVARNYMHLKYERVFIIMIALVPVVLAMGLAIALIPDIAMHR